VLPPSGLQAFADGGDVLLYELREDIGRADLQRLTTIDGVRKVQRTDTGLRFVVGDGERDAAAVEAALAGLGTTATREHYEPSFEDLFVTIVERDRAQRAAPEAA